ncbi:hypothetical protein EDB80DRAFT_867244 [Ilyonectria destructans]|nr:hypothetical protein EDB80DRAFT_867244 [Ilyonectria destructans]
MVWENDDLILIKLFLVNNHDSYDTVDLAARLAKRDLISFSQIAANIYRNDKCWEKLIAISKPDKLHKKAIDTSALSANIVVVEDAKEAVTEVEYCSENFLMFPTPTSASLMSKVSDPILPSSTCLWSSLFDSRSTTRFLKRRTTKPCATLARTTAPTTTFELAARLEKHDLIFFRQIAANDYRKKISIGGGSLH